jgi:hypothetical protein
VAGLTRSALTRLLAERGLKASLIKRVESCLAEAESGRYAPNAASSTQAGTLLQQVDRLIGDLEKFFEYLTPRRRDCGYNKTLWPWPSPCFTTSRRSYTVKRILVVFSFICLTLLGLWMVNQVPSLAKESDMSAAAGQLYESGQYALAAQAYQQLVDQGYADSALFYNLGTLIK